MRPSFEETHCDMKNFRKKKTGQFLKDCVNGLITFKNSGRKKNKNKNSRRERNQETKKFHMGKNARYFGG